MPLRTAYREGIQPPLEEPKQHTQPAKAPTQRINPEEVRQIRDRQSKMSISETKRSFKLKETEMLLRELIDVTTSPLGQRKK